jgi:hypothetical protein
LPKSLMQASPSNALGVIAILVGIVELAFAYPVTTLTGNAQLVVIGFMVSFPILLLAGFFLVLIKYPENFYSPSDFQNPELFTQLVSRRDLAINNELKHRTSILEGLVSDLKNELNRTAPSVESLSTKIDSIPRINQDELNIVIDRVIKVIDMIELAHNKQDHFPIETCWKHGLMGINGIWFANSERWSLRFLMETAVSILTKLGKEGIPDEETSGSIEVESGGDYNAVFKYKLTKPEYGTGMDLKIKFDREYCTIS